MNQVLIFNGRFDLFKKSWINPKDLLYKLDEIIDHYKLISIREWFPFKGLQNINQDKTKIY